MSMPGGIDWSQVDVAVPTSGRVPGIWMAGFHHLGSDLVDIAMVPHPAVTVLVDLSGRGVVHDGDAGAHPRSGSVVIGLSPGPVRFANSGAGELLQIRLSPLVAAAVLGDPEVLGGAITPLADLWGQRAESFEEQLRTLPTWAERFALASRVLSGQTALGHPADPEIAYAWTETARHRGRVRIETLAEETGWSRQRLWSRFRAQIGLSPKRAAELVRFDHAARLLSVGRPPADVACRAGYTDQSHLHRQIKLFTRETPSALAKASWLAIDDVAWPTPGRRTT